MAAKMVSMLLEGKTALVTGAAKGVGRGIALELAKEGCDVAINDLTDSAGAEATAAQIRGMGRQAFAVLADVGAAAE
ncbi:MAG TPA: SDR family NAD(P)-dependent oxidoreductase, partial [Bryobacteraceae bacterium]|nr:SDR family NAD(P)-dependent oxidoreductase [Bryobacteraceae bacterium]